MISAKQVHAEERVKPFKFNQTKAVSELHNEFTYFGDFILTKRGSLIGGIELRGLDSDGLIAEDLEGLSTIARAFYRHIDNHLTVTQYFAHYDGVEVTMADRQHPISDMLSKRRQSFINNQKLSSSRLVHFFEISPSEALSQLGAFDLFKHILQSPFDLSSREAVTRHFSSTKSILCYIEELERQSSTLHDYLDDVVSRWDGVFGPKKMTRNEVWAFNKFLANLNHYYLDGAYTADAPKSGWDSALPDGDRTLVRAGNMDLIKLNSSLPVYARIMSVNNFKGESIAAGMWAKGKQAPVRQKGNFLLMMRFQPLSNAQKDSMFRGKESGLNRQNYDLMGMLSSNRQQVSELERRELMKPAIKKSLDDLGEAEMLDDVWGKGHASIVIWADNPNTIRTQSVRMKRAADRVNLSTCWEGVGLPRAYRTLQVAGRPFTLRDIPITATQFSAASLLYAPSLGQKTVPDLNDEEAQYVFIGEDGSPFHYSPFVNERAVVIGVGPIRSGKSFTKNTLASHFAKYGGFIQGIDLDQGLEPVAMSFGEDGGIYRTEDHADAGFNPFASLQDGENDKIFINHLRSLMILMIANNDNEEMKTVTAEEQLSLDRAIIDTIRIDPRLHRLGTVVRHCVASLQRKLARWVYSIDGGDDGLYAQFFDSKQDAIGAVDRPVMAYNLKSIKDNHVVLPLVMAEIFFRTTRAFEDLSKTHIPKYLDIDEAHVMLGMDYTAEYLVRFVRTSGKYKAGIGLWSQNPAEFGAIKGWSAIRSAASTFFFMSDPNMDEDQYKEVFKLTSGECDAIKNLKPKFEAFIIQRDLGIAKKVILSVEAEQYVVSTSKGSETKIRNENFKTLGFAAGLDKTVADLGLTPTKDEKEIT